MTHPVQKARKETGCEKEKGRVTEREKRKRPGIVWLRGRKNRRDSKTKKS
jgi:hypothetical protein